MRAPDSQRRRNSFAQHPVHFGDAFFAVYFNKSVPLREIIKFPAD